MLVARVTPDRLLAGVMYSWRVQTTRGARGPGPELCAGPLQRLYAGRMLQHAISFVVSFVQTVPLLL
jgi:hypothetical protein